MKRLWQEISESIIRSAASVTFVVISIVLIGCTQKSHDVKPAVSQPEIENRNERLDTAEVEDTSIYRPSVFTYDKKSKTTNAEDEYNDRLDAYLDDPEDELRFDPEIFDFQDE